MLSSRLRYKDLSKSNIYELFLFFINKKMFNTMSVYGKNIIEEENIDIDRKKIYNLIQNDRFGFILTKQNLRFEIDRNPINNQKIGMRIIEPHNNIFNIVFEHFKDEKLIYAKRENKDYVDWHQNLNLDFWEYMKWPIPKPMKYFPVFDFHNPNRKALSIEHIPHHRHYMQIDEQLIFGAAWQMYFSEIYYKFIPKPLFDDFNDCYENTILENGIRKITLYENHNDYLKLRNTKRYWSFRRKLGIDTIAHELKLEKNRIEPENLPVEITKKDCKKGTTKVTRHLDKKLNLINSNKAKYREIKEYLDDGVTIILERIEKA